MEGPTTATEAWVSCAFWLLQRSKYHRISSDQSVIPSHSAKVFTDTVWNRLIIHIQFTMAMVPTANRRDPKAMDVNGCNFSTAQLHKYNVSGFQSMWNFHDALELRYFAYSKLKHFFNAPKHKKADVQPGGGLVLGSMFCNAQSTTFWVLKERVRMTHHPHGIHQWKQRLGKEKCGWRLMSPRQCLTLNVKLRTKIMQLNTAQLAHHHYFGSPLLKGRAAQKLQNTTTILMDSCMISMSLHSFQNCFGSLQLHQLHPVLRIHSQVP